MYGSAKSVTVNPSFTILLLLLLLLSVVIHFHIFTLHLHIFIVIVLVVVVAGVHGNVPFMYLLGKEVVDFLRQNRGQGCFPDCGSMVIPSGAVRLQGKVPFSRGADPIARMAFCIASCYNKEVTGLSFVLAQRWLAHVVGKRETVLNSLGHVCRRRIVDELDAFRSLWFRVD